MPADKAPRSTPEFGSTPNEELPPELPPKQHHSEFTFRRRRLNATLPSRALIDGGSEGWSEREAGKQRNDVESSGTPAGRIGYPLAAWLYLS